MERFAKQVIVMRKDLGMRKGKMIAQGAHASMKVLLDAGSLDEGRTSFALQTWPALAAWLGGRFTKVCVGVENEAALDAVVKKARAGGVPGPLIVDSVRPNSTASRRRHAARSGLRGPTRSTPSPEASAFCDKPVVMSAKLAVVSLVFVLGCKGDKSESKATKHVEPRPQVKLEEALPSSFPLPESATRKLVRSQARLAMTIWEYEYTDLDAKTAADKIHDGMISNGFTVKDSSNRA